VEAKIQFLFLIGAYRDNEVNSAHPLMLNLKEIKESGSVVHSLTLRPLGLDTTNELIADTLKASMEKTLPLSKLVYSKTDGNPFFLREFLHSLYVEKLLKFDFEDRSWQWDLEQIKNQNFTDNVVELMAGKIQKLPLETQESLKLAACIGNQFNLETLTFVNARSAQETIVSLKTGVSEGLLLPLAENYKAIELDTLASVELATVEYRFVHDRIQQASYCLIPDHSKQRVHRQVGQLLLENTPENRRDEKIFDIVNQLNQALELVDASGDRIHLAQLNLTAGQKAKASAAYEPALKYLTVGIELLSESDWQSQFDLCLALYETAAEASYLCGDFEQMEQLAEKVLHHATALLDRVKVYEIKIQAYMAQARGMEAVRTGVQVLRLLGIELNENPQLADIQQAIAQTETMLAGREIADLFHLPAMTEPEKLAAMQILSGLSSATYISAPQMYPLTVCERVKLSLQYGNAPWSAFAYATYGLILCGVVQDIERGYQFGQLALNVANHFNAKEVKTKSSFIFGGMIQHWKDPIRNTLKPLLAGYQWALETGDLEFGAYCACYACHHLYFAGEELTKLEQEIAGYSHVLDQWGQIGSYQYNEIFRQAILNLMGQEMNHSPSQLLGEAYNEVEQIHQHHQGNDRNGLHYLYLNKLILSYLFEELPQAIENATQAETYLDSVVALLCVPTFYFYDSLVQLAICQTASSAERDRALSKVAENQQKMQLWAHNAPKNHRHQYDLVEAERHSVLGQLIEAMDAYEQAISGAKSSHHLHEEALAYELAAKFYLAQGKELVAKSYFQEAYYCYFQWGAAAKTKQLEQKYPQFVLQVRSNSIIGNSSTITNHSTHKQSGANLDLETVVKASQAISGEIILEQLLRNLMKILLENAGAQAGCLLLPSSQGELYIEASGTIESDKINVLQSLPIANQLPESLVNYVARTHQSIVLNNATEEGEFTEDSYIREHALKSILCMPLINQGQLTSILYLENNLTTNAFTSDRLEILQILSAQAAISIENARLYQTLEDKVSERTIQLAEANQEIMALNEELKVENLRMSAELDIVRRMQKMILPKQQELEAIEGLDIAGFMEPADEVGGDYYDVLYQDGITTLGIGDVTGHGLESGILMVMVQTAVRLLKEIKEQDPVKFLDTLNRTLYQNLQRMNSDKNLTLAILNYFDGRLTISGQHEDVLIVRADGQIERINTTYLGFPIGLEKDIASFISQISIELKPGDGLVLYTDGITEAFDIDNKLYGIERLCKVISQTWKHSAQTIVQAVVKNLQQYIGEQKVFDDISLLILKRK
jgi:predicted ATPase/serine phosphatase RsbU (regulator of sigma subunit)